MLQKSEKKKRELKTRILHNQNKANYKNKTRDKETKSIQFSYKKITNITTTI